MNITFKAILISFFLVTWWSWQGRLTVVSIQEVLLLFMTSQKDLKMYIHFRTNILKLWEVGLFWLQRGSKRDRFLHNVWSWKPRKPLQQDNNKQESEEKVHLLTPDTLQPYYTFPGMTANHTQPEWSHYEVMRRPWSHCHPIGSLRPMVKQSSELSCVWDTPWTGTHAAGRVCAHVTVCVCVWRLDGALQSS